MKDCCILIPYYNSGHELVVSVKSIIMDGFIPDIIIVDDGSTIKASKQLSSIDWKEIRIVMLSAVGLNLFQ